MKGPYVLRIAMVLWKLRIIQSDTVMIIVHNDLDG